VTTAIPKGLYVDPRRGRITIGELYMTWYATHDPLWKPSWSHRVAIVWNTHVKPDWGQTPVSDVESGGLRRWVAGLSSRRSPSTTLKAVNIMRGILDDAVTDHRIPSNPLKGVELPKRHRRKTRRVYLTASQVIAFADECANARSMGRERRALVLLLGFCGLRWGEAAALRVGDVDFRGHRVRVASSLVRVGSGYVEGSPKSWEARSVPLPRVVESALRGVCAGRGSVDRLFSDASGAPIRPQSVGDGGNNRTWWVSALKRLGYARDDMPSPHDLRHTAASIAVHAGANVKALQRMLGHARASMTLDVYADLFDSDLDDVARLVDATVDVETRADRSSPVGVPAGKCA
jgi:integrase